MDSKDLKKVFSEIAKSNGFDHAFGGWLKESTECIAVLDLQKSNFGNYYEMNLKIYVQGIFGNTYIRNKDLIKKDTGDVFRRQPPEYRDILDSDTPMNDAKRKDRLEKLFTEFIVPFTDKALSKRGLMGLAEKGEVTLLPAVIKELSR